MFGDGRYQVFKTGRRSTLEWRPEGSEVRLDSGLELDRLLPRPLLLHCIVLVCDFMLKDSCCFFDENMAAGVKNRSDKKSLKTQWHCTETKAPWAWLCREGDRLCSSCRFVRFSGCAH